jgi:hypothetical protein
VNPSQVSPDGVPEAEESPHGADRLPGASLGSRSKALLLTPVLIVVMLGVGWLAWSVVEWWHGRNPSYRVTRLRVVRKSDLEPVGLGRSLVRELCCALLLLPTLVACCFLAIAFTMGASPAEGMFSQSRRAPWDVLTGTDVVSEPRH